MNPMPRAWPRRETGPNGGQYTPRKMRLRGTAAQGAAGRVDGASAREHTQSLKPTGHRDSRLRPGSAWRPRRAAPCSPPQCHRACASPWMAYPARNHGAGKVRREQGVSWSRAHAAPSLSAHQPHASGTSLRSLCTSLFSPLTGVMGIHATSFHRL